MKTLLILLSLSLSSLSYYGEDSRKDFYQLTSSVEKNLARAVAFRLDKHELRGWTFQRYWKIVSKPFSDRNVCEGERFSSQQTIRRGCSAVLVSPKHLLTAGNCTRQHYCYNDLFYWMFNHHLEEEGIFPEKRHKKNFYKCEKVVKDAYDPEAGVSFSLLELEEEVVGVSPVKIADHDFIPEEDELITMGHTRGLPLKIAGGARVLDQNADFFLINSDIAAATRGAAIFNKRSHELEGILIHGTPNYTNNGGCLESVALQDSYGGEVAIKAKFIKRFLKSVL